MGRIIIGYVLLLILLFLIWFYGSSVFSKIGKPFKEQSNKIKENMGEED